MKNMANRAQFLHRCPYAAFFFYYNPCSIHVSLLHQSSQVQSIPIFNHCPLRADQGLVELSLCLSSYTP